MLIIVYSHSGYDISLPL